MKSAGKKVLFISLLFPVLLCLCACNVRSTRQLKQEAKLTYGPAKVVSESKSQNCNTVVLRDKLQGFEYTITSSMKNLNVDNTSFGDWESTSCDFEIRLQEYVVTNARDDLDDICAKYHATWKTPDYYTKDVLLKLSVEDASDAKALGEEVARLMQTQNLKNRMDGVVIYVQDTDENTLGQVDLPGCIYK